MTTQAQITLEILTDRIRQFDPQESEEIWELVDKLNMVVNRYESSAQLAIMIVGMQIAIGRGQ